MRITPAVLFCTLVALGCQPAAGPTANSGIQAAAASGPTTSTAEAEPTTGPAPVPGSAESAVMATVNGRPVYMDALIRPLLEVHGPRIAEIVIAHALVEQEAQRQGLSVTAEEIAAEKDAALTRVVGEDLSRDQRERMLEQLLRRVGLTHSLWDATGRQNALLTKMAEPRVLITEAMVKAEFGRLYGEKVQLSHIAVPTLSEAEKLIKMLKAGEDFAELARKYSTNSVTAKQGGLLPPFSRDEPSVPQAMREVAFSLEEGQTSGIVQAGNDFHVLKLHRRLPSETVQFEAVREQVRKILRRRLIEQLHAEMLSELRRKARVEIIDPILREAAARQSRP